LIEPILIRNGLPGAAAALVCGDIEVGKELVGSEDIPLGMCALPQLQRGVRSRKLMVVSFTGSEKVGKEVAKVVQDRFGKVLLELGGNNGMSTISIYLRDRPAVLIYSGNCR
jgi:aldehyde dehydrogenase family 7 protein A1